MLIEKAKRCTVKGLGDTLEALRVAFDHVAHLELVGVLKVVVLLSEKVLFAASELKADQGGTLPRQGCVRVVLVLDTHFLDEAARRLQQARELFHVVERACEGEITSLGPLIEALHVEGG